MEHSCFFNHSQVVPITTVSLNDCNYVHDPTTYFSNSPPLIPGVLIVSSMSLIGHLFDYFDSRHRYISLVRVYAQSRLLDWFGCRCVSYRERLCYYSVARVSRCVTVMEEQSYIERDQFKSSNSIVNVLGDYSQTLFSVLIVLHVRNECFRSVITAM